MRAFVILTPKILPPIVKCVNRTIVKVKFKVTMAMMNTHNYIIKRHSTNEFV